MRSDRERLLDIVEAIERIQKYAQQGREAFDSNELVQIWMVHHLQVIGEAVQRLSPELRDRHQQIPWHAIVGMRNIVVHTYFAVDLDVIWVTIEKDLADLESSIRSLLSSIDE
ncbi:MAG: DUF86 domain-containing protein [bacterium]|nr:DUF86 domain-containing protein [bacterium]